MMHFDMKNTLKNNHKHTLKLELDTTIASCRPSTGDPL